MARAQLQHLPEQDEHGDDDRRIEVRVDRPVHAEAFGEEIRRGRRDRAVSVRSADADADQREHVGARIRERLPHPFEERRTAPEHDRRRKNQPYPVDRRDGDASSNRAARKHVAHRQQEHRRAERHADPEPSRHVDELGVRRVRKIRGARFERHPVFRTGTRLV